MIAFRLNNCNSLTKSLLWAMIDKNVQARIIDGRKAVMKILICDDETAFCESMKARVSAYVKNIGISADVVSVSSMEQLNGFDFSTIDIAFLDVMIGQKATGIELAKEIHAARKDAVLIFVTASVEFAPQAFEVQAFRYLLKSQLSEKLHEYLGDAIAAYKSAHQTFTFVVNNEAIDIAVQDIAYAEVDRRKILLHLCDTSVLHAFYFSMTALAEELSPMGFLRVHRSFLINMKHIKKLNHSSVLLDNGAIIPVSEHAYRDVKQQYELWLEQEKWIVA